MVEPQAQSGESRVLAYLDREVVDFARGFRRIPARSGAGSSRSFWDVLPGAGRGRWRDDGSGVPDTISRTAAVVAPGLMVMAIILFMGKVSGAHLNPAVSIAFALRGDFPWRRVPGYIVVQLIGATLAALFLLRRDRRLRDVRVELPGLGVLRRRRVSDGGGADARAWSA